MKHYRLILGIILAAALSSCSRGEMDFIDFSKLDGADHSVFKVISSKVTDLEDGLPKDCHIWEEDLSATKTTSVPMTTILADLLDYNNKGKVIEVAGTYNSYDLETGECTTLSGKLLLPKSRKPKRYIVVSHYTIGANFEAPSNCFPLEGLIADMGYAMIFPDYEGFGVDSDRVHPYLVLQQQALDVYMMYYAVREFLKNTEYAPQYDDIYLMGYSQGGAVTMGTLWFIEDVIGKTGLVRQVFSGGGPYDVRATYNNFIESDNVNIPAAIPMVIQGMFIGNGLNLDMNDFLQPWLMDNLDKWINSKSYTVAQLKSMMGTTHTSDILTEKGLDRTSEEVSELYKALSANSVLALNWTPSAPVYMLHSMEDDVVPFINASKAKTKWADANIQYNFGYYGSHTQTALRFILSVKTWLKEEGE
ncbi:MAG: lipase family protein [Candidatus Cryptobacteroides sp.]